MGRAFRWIEWNVGKAQKHGVTPQEAEMVVRNAGHGQIRREGEKLVMQGRGQRGRFVQVIYVQDDDGTFFVIHAMPLAAGKRRRRK